MKNKKKIRCGKCFVTLERLKGDGIAEYLFKIINEDGEEDFICPTCKDGW